MPIKVFCDKCQKQITSEYAEFNYLKTIIVQQGRGGIGKTPVKMTFCQDCKDKIISFIEKDEKI